MRILLAHNSLYNPSHGGGDKSNRLLMQALADRGHQVLVVARIESFGISGHERLLAELAQRNITIDSIAGGVVRFHLGGVDVRTLTTNPRLRAYFAEQVEQFSPDIIITSTDDPAQLLFEIAIRAEKARVIHLVRATIAVPFGWHSSWPVAQRTRLLQHADAVVGVSESVAQYCREEGGLDAVHVPISLMEGTEFPDLARFDSDLVTLVNPCAVKGISIFLALAERMPQLQFAGVKMWGTTADDIAAMRRLPNIRVLDPVDDINQLLAKTRVMLVPSVWVEARSRMVCESMLRGVPVIASNIGGIPEAKLGVPYLIPVEPVRHYRHAVSDNMVPIAEVPPQNIDPWCDALTRLTTDRDHYQEIARQSRRAALDYVHNLSASPFEQLLFDVLRRPGKSAPPLQTADPSLSDQKKKLLAIRLKQIQTKLWFPMLADLPEGSLRLFAFPHAGGGATQYRAWTSALPQGVALCPVCLPGREARASETPFDDMAALIQILASEIAPHLNQPFAFFGHSMGAGVAFELTRELQRRSLPQPAALFVSSARAPRYRIGLQPQPDPTDEELAAQLRPELLESALPALRADTRLYRNYRYEPGDPLEVPLYIYGGRDDPALTAAQLEPWSEVTTGPTQLRLFPGGHFYLFDHPAGVLTDVAQALAPALPSYPGVTGSVNRS